jgi:hypothetical protein
MSHFLFLLTPNVRKQTFPPLFLREGKIIADDQGGS